MKKLVLAINNNIHRKKLFKNSEKLIVGISAGQDSLALFFSLLHLKQQWNINIQLVYCHHFWQNINFLSFHHILQVAWIFKTPIYFFISQKSVYTENCSRLWRLHAFQRTALFQDCFDLSNDNKKKITLKVLTAHTATDRLETSLWHLIRGTSTSGLVSLETKKDFFITLSNRQFVRNIKITQSFDCVFSVYGQKIYECIYTKLNIFKIKNTSLYTVKNCINPQLYCGPNKWHLGVSLTMKQRALTFAKKNLVLKQNKRINDLQLKIEARLSIKGVNKIGFIFNDNRGKYKFRNHNMFFLYNYVLDSTCTPQISTISLLRPLSTIDRNYITNRIRFLKLPVLTDITNFHVGFSRNRIRYQLLPFIRYSFNQKFDRLFFNFIIISTFDNEYLEYLTDKMLSNWLLSTPYCNIVNNWPSHIQRRCIKKLFFIYKRTQLNYIQTELIRLWAIKK